jgi:hypothetical protein
MAPLLTRSPAVKHAKLLAVDILLDDGGYLRFREVGSHLLVTVDDGYPQTSLSGVTIITHCYGKYLSMFR